MMISKQTFKTFVKYAIVGVSGTAIDVGGFTLLVAYTSLNHFVAAALTFSIAVINNFTWNTLWTYKDRPTVIRHQLPKFFVVSLGGLILNLLCLWIFKQVILFGMIKIGFLTSVQTLPTWGETLAKLSASALVLVYNFSLNTWWTFKKHSASPS